jgi:hypothetical protein
MINAGEIGARHGADRCYEARGHVRELLCYVLLFHTAILIFD